MRQRRFGQEEHREDVGPEGPLQLLGADLFDAVLRVLLCRVVDQNIELTQLADRLLNDLLAVGFVADVTGDGDAAAPLLLDLALGLLGVLLLIEVGNRHIGAFLGEVNRHRAADPGVATGNQCDLTLELPAASVAGILRHRLRRHLRFDARLLVLLLRRHRLFLSLSHRSLSSPVVSTVRHISARGRWLSDIRAGSGGVPCCMARASNG